MLVYDVELLAIAPPPAWPTPADMRSVPADATRLSSGLAFKVLRRGTGTERPKPMSTATLHYTAWTTNGTTIFDDTVARDAPMTAAVDTLIPGLSEGLQRMVVGERARFWIPADLGYAPPLPRASTVFDV